MKLGWVEIFKIFFCCLISLGSALGCSAQYANRYCIFGIDTEILTELVRLQDIGQGDSVLISCHSLIPSANNVNGLEFAICNDKIQSHTITYSNKSEEIRTFKYDHEEISKVETKSRKLHLEYERVIDKRRGDSLYYLVNGKHSIIAIHDSKGRNLYYRNIDTCNNAISSFTNLFGSGNVIFGIAFDMPFNIKYSYSGFFRPTVIIDQTEGPPEHTYRQLLITKRKRSGRLQFEKLMEIPSEGAPKLVYELKRIKNKIILVTGYDNRTTEFEFQDSDTIKKTIQSANSDSLVQYFNVRIIKQS